MRYVRPWSAVDAPELSELLENKMLRAVNAANGTSKTHTAHLYIQQYSDRVVEGGYVNTNYYVCVEDGEQGAAPML